MSEGFKTISNNGLLVRLKISETFQEVIDGEPYEGEYIITPKPNEATVLETANKRMTDNVTVLEIPYSEVDNLAGGQTITIGGN